MSLPPIPTTRIHWILGVLFYIGIICLPALMFFVWPILDRLHSPD